MCYTTKFFITTYTYDNFYYDKENGRCVQDGNKDYRYVERSWVQYIDESLIGTVALTSEEDNSSEELGTEIKIPIESNDFNEVQKAVIKYTEFIKVQPKCNVPLVYQKKIATYEGDNWLFYQEDHSSRYNRLILGSKIIIDSIPYPLSISSLNNDPSDERSKVYSRLFNLNNCYLFFKTGELDVSNSRETLQYTKKTIATIDKRIEEILEDIHLFLSSKLALQDSLYKACCYLHALPQVKQIVKQLHWQNYPVQEKYKLGNNINVETCEISRYKGNSSYENYVNELVVDSYSSRENDVIFLNDTLLKSPRRYVNAYLSTHPEVSKTYTISYNDITDITIDLTPFNVLKLSNIKLQVNEVRAAIKTVSAFKYADGHERNRAQGFIKYFTPQEVIIEADEPYYYLVLSKDNECSIGNTIISSYYSQQLRELFRAFTAINGLNLNYSRIYLIKQSSIKRLGSNWVSMEESCKEFIESRSQRIDLVSLLDDYHQRGYLFKQQLSNLSFIVDRLSPDNIISQYYVASKVASLKLELNEYLLILANLFSSNDNYSPKFENMLNTILERYTLLKTFRIDQFYINRFLDSNKEDLTNGLIDYINHIDNKTSITVDCNRRFDLTMSSLLKLLK